MISKTQFEDWLDNQVTRAYFEAANMRIQDAKDVLSESAGLDSDQDNFFRGFIAAYEEMKQFRVEDMTND